MIDVEELKKLHIEYSNYIQKEDKSLGTVRGPLYQTILDGFVTWLKTNEQAAQPVAAPRRLRRG